MQRCIRVVAMARPITYLYGKKVGSINPVSNMDSITAALKKIGDNPTEIEQALLLAHDKWLAKKEVGYKSLPDLGISIVGPTQDCIDARYTSQSVHNWREHLRSSLEEALPKETTLITQKRTT